MTAPTIQQGADPGQPAAGLVEAAKKAVDAWGRWSILDDLSPTTAWLDAMDDLEVALSVPTQGPALPISVHVTCELPQVQQGGDNAR